MSLPNFHTLPARTSFYFVRHGESVSNSKGRIQGRTESPLSSIGRDHANAAGTWLAARDVDAIFTSPLSRCTQTARIIADTINVADGGNGLPPGRGCPAPRPVVLDDLKELDTGEFTGRSLSQVAEEDPDLFARFRMHSWEAVPGAESVTSLAARARSVWTHLISGSVAGRRAIVCVTHGGLIQWLIKVTLNPEPDSWMPIFPADNCGIFQFVAEPTVPANAEAPSGGELPNGRGYFGVWRRINEVPYRDDSQRTGSDKPVEPPAL